MGKGVFNLSKITKVLVFINVGLLTFFLNMADISSGSQAISGINNYILPKANGLPSTLFENTNPTPKKNSLSRGLASEKSESNQKDKKSKTEEKKENEESESYSLLDPNLYEDGSDGASTILQINQINNRLSQ